MFSPFKSLHFEEIKSKIADICCRFDYMTLKMQGQNAATVRVLYSVHAYHQDSKTDFEDLDIWLFEHVCIAMAYG